jgi:hypothetical protein
MSRQPTEPVPLPTDDEMAASLEKDREIVAHSAKNRGRLLYLKLAFHTGDIGVVHLDPIRADYLLQTLQKFLPKSPEHDGSPVKWESEGLEDQQGHLPVAG